MNRPDRGKPAYTVGALYKTLSRGLRRFFIDHLQDEEAAEDLCHEVFLRLLLADASGARPEDPQAWMTRVASNLLIDTYRRRRVQRAREMLIEGLSCIADSEAWFWNLLERRHLLEEVQETVRTLPRKARLLLFWREIEGVPTRAIAQRLRKAETVVSTELSRARRQFRREFLRRHFAGLLDPDEEIVVEPASLRPFDPHALPEHQLGRVRGRVRHYFDDAARTWDHYVFTAYDARLRERLQRLVPWERTMTVLDVGTGTGFLAEAVAPLVGEVIAVDFSSRMLHIAAQKVAARDHRVSLRQGDAERPPVERGSVDVAICHMLLHHVVSPRQVLGEMWRRVRSGGFVVVIDADRHEHPWTLEAFGDVHYGVDRARVSAYLRALGARAMRVQDAGVSKSGATVGREAIFSNFLVVARVE